MSKPTKGPRIVAVKVAGGWDVGTCLDCVGRVGHGRCAFHAAEDRQRERTFSALLQRTVEAMRADEIGRICARYELESDEMQTREEKAASILARF